jgi:hypothetical protein
MSTRTPDHTHPDREPATPADGSTSDGEGHGRRASDRRQPEAPGPHPDRALALLLLAAERDVRVGLTVTVGSTVVTGTLIGTIAYFRAFADRFTSATGRTEMHEDFADAFRGLFDETVDQTRGDRRSPPDPEAYEQTAAFVHLEDARYVTATGLLPQGRYGVLFRCPVSDLTGWSVGELIAP